MRILTAILMTMAVASWLVGCHRPDPNARHIPVTMKRYAFDPAEIHIRRGESVVLDVTTLDVQHGFKVSALDVDEAVQKRSTTSIELTINQAGEYQVECSILCGPHHEEMRGKIIVE